jgi:hypothetical protein
VSTSPSEPTDPFDAQLLAGLGESLRAHVPHAASEIETVIIQQISQYVRPSTPRLEQVVKEAVARATRLFVDYLGSPDSDRAELTELFSGLGVMAARNGQSLDTLQMALRMSSQVACRRFIRDAYRFGWPQETLELLTDTLFALLGQAADVAARSYAAEQNRRASDLQRRQERLRDVLVGDPAADRDRIAELAEAARWPVPMSIAVVALSPVVAGSTGILPPNVLSHLDIDASPFLIVPEPDSAAGHRITATMGRTGPVTVGPTVSVTQGAISRRWALRALDLVERGVLAANPVPRCADHAATLAAYAADDLLDVIAERRLAPLMQQNPRRRLSLMETLLAYLECGDSAPMAASRLGVHEQTVRYRLRRIEELLGPLTRDPAARLDLMLVLGWLVRTSGDGGSGTVGSDNRTDVRVAGSA